MSELEKKNVTVDEKPKPAAAAAAAAAPEKETIVDGSSKKVDSGMKVENKENVDRKAEGGSEKGVEKKEGPENEETPTASGGEGDEKSEKDHQGGGKKGGKSSKSRSRRRHGKKGSWKKLDVDISFSKEASITPTAPPSSNNNNHHRKAARQHSSRPKRDHKKPNPTPPSASSTQTQQPKPVSQPTPKDKPDMAPTTTTPTTTSTSPPKQQNHPVKKHKPKKTHPHTSSKAHPKQAVQQSPHYSPHTEAWFPDLTPDQLQQLKPQAAAQIEYFFTPNELCRNTFLRLHMDTHGYIPAALVFNFPSVVRFGVPYNDLLHALNEHSSMLHVDFDNETIRLKHNYEKWLYPNQEGGFGCPRWIKQPLENQNNMEEEEMEKEEQFQIEEEEQKENKEDQGNMQQQHEHAKNHKQHSRHDDGTISTTPDLVHCTDSDDSEHSATNCTT